MAYTGKQVYMENQQPTPKTNRLHTLALQLTTCEK